MRLSPSEAPKPPKVKESFLTYVRTRNPQFKIHANRSSAGSALTYHMPDDTVALYQQVDGDWSCIFYYVPSDNCESCGDRMGSKYSPGVTRYRFWMPGVPGYMCPVVCHKCAD